MPDTLSQNFDGIMVGRLIQNNPFCLLKVDKLFFGNEIKNNYYQKIIVEYFQYIKKNLGSDSIFRLLSPLLYIFFGFPNSKKFKSDILYKIKNQEIDSLESIFLQFSRKQKI